MDVKVKVIGLNELDKLGVDRLDLSKILSDAINKMREDKEKDVNEQLDEALEGCEDGCNSCGGCECSCTPFNEEDEECGFNCDSCGECVEDNTSKHYAVTTIIKKTRIAKACDLETVRAHEEQLLSEAKAIKLSDTDIIDFMITEI